MFDTVAMVFSGVLFEGDLDSIQELVNCLISHCMDAHLVTGLVKDPKHLL